MFYYFCIIVVSPPRRAKLLGNNCVCFESQTLGNKPDPISCEKINQTFALNTEKCSGYRWKNMVINLLSTGNSIPCSTVEKVRTVYFLRFIEIMIGVEIWRLRIMLFCHMSEDLKTQQYLAVKLQRQRAFWQWLFFWSVTVSLFTPDIILSKSKTQVSLQVGWGWVKFYPKLSLHIKKRPELNPICKT